MVDTRKRNFDCVARDACASAKSENLRSIPLSDGHAKLRGKDLFKDMLPVARSSRRGRIALARYLQDRKLAVILTVRQSLPGLTRVVSTGRRNTLS